MQNPAKKIRASLLLGSLLLLTILLGGAWISGSPDAAELPTLSPAKPGTATSVQHLSRGLQFPTVATPSMTDTSSFEALQTYLRATYPRTFATLQSFPEVAAPSMVLHWQGRHTEKPVLLLAHQDVVPVAQEDLSAWAHPPWSGAVTDGYIWGRGAIDDKMSLFAILESVEMLLQQGYQPPRDLWFVFGHDEEIGGTTGARRVADWFAQQQIHFATVLDEGGMILSDIVPGLEQPVALIGIAEKGYLSLRFRVEVEGGHSSMPPRESALGILAEAMHTLEATPLPSMLTHINPLLDALAPALGLGPRIVLANRWLFGPLLETALGHSRQLNALIRTTTALTMAQGSPKENVLPNRAEAVVNFRILPGNTIESTIREVEQIVDDARVQITPLPFQSEPSSVSDPDTDDFRTLAAAIMAVAPVTPVLAPNLFLAATDSRHFAAVADNVYRFFYLETDKADLGRIHGIGERVSIDSYTRAVQFYGTLLQNLPAAQN